jgi:WD40 repeat protein
MLLAEQAVELDRSSQTEGTLLATLLRSPAAVATFTTPIQSRPQKIALSPDGRTLAVSDNLADVRLYDIRTRRQRSVLHNLGYTNAVAYLPDGSAFVAFGGTNTRELEVIDARTLEPKRVLHYDRRMLRAAFAGVLGGFAHPLVSSDGRTLLYAYDVLRADGSDGPAFVDRWNLQTGKLASTTPVGAAGANDASLIERGRRLAVGGTTGVTILDARTMRPVRRVRLQSASPIGDDVVSPDGRTVAFGTMAGSVSFVDVATRRLTPGVGGHAAAVQAMAFSPVGWSSRAGTTAASSSGARRPPRRSSGSSATRVVSTGSRSVATARRFTPTASTGRSSRGISGPFVASGAPSPR